MCLWFTDKHGFGEPMQKSFVILLKFFFLINKGFIFAYNHLNKVNILIANTSVFPKSFKLNLINDLNYFSVSAHASSCLPLLTRLSIGLKILSFKNLNKIVNSKCKKGKKEFAF